MFLVSSPLVFAVMQPRRQDECCGTALRPANCSADQACLTAQVLELRMQRRKSRRRRFKLTGSRQQLGTSCKRHARAPLYTLPTWAQECPAMISVERESASHMALRMFQVRNLSTGVTAAHP